MIQEQFDLSDKTAMVVGGRGFLGRRFSAALAEFGANVYATDLSDPSAAARHDLSEHSLANINQRTMDVTSAESVRTVINEIVRETSHIDILVYSVTAKPKDFYLPFTECSLEGWQTIMHAESDGLFIVAREVGRVMESSETGSMIFLSSIYGIVGNDQRIYENANLAELYAGDSGDKSKRIYAHAGYAAAKGAVISLTRYLAAYWGNRGIRVNCVSPGGVAHPAENEDFIKKYSERTPLGRKAGIDEISGAIIYLASDSSSYVTGHNLVVDGGWSIW